ncbi:MAG TPA: N(4)-(beta-N-acetylglucosaminyl)-L-asparaginase, partial [Thermoanaerobaculia bacterium]|nr:N(4)-(beta-N-acetylglucosaminyl)-L-asparaginase [Thermoanaerobaculia bacterium]
GDARQQGRKLRGRGMPGGAVAIASANGLEAVKAAHERLAAGSDPVDAAVEGVKIVELDPNDYTVGYGGLPNFDGVVELDAAVMHGPSAKAGAVGALQGVKTPAQVARLVMQRTDHIMLVGEGARRFATMNGFANENLLTEFSRKVWLYWRENLSELDDYVEPPASELDPDVRRFLEENKDLFRPTGTIHLSARTAAGDLGCCTTTSGLFFKVPGRVGDSPIIGAGLYCDNDVGSAGATGRGEASIGVAASHSSVELMRQGLAPEQALLKVLERVVHLNRNPLLKRADGKPNFNLKLYAVNKAGVHAGAALWSGGQYAVADARGARLEEMAYLYRSP